MEIGMTLWLGHELTTLAFCWRLERRDGVAMGFTSHDRDLDVLGFRYRATPGMTPSAIVKSGGLDVDTLDVSGALSSEAITGRDLAAGRWDGARLRLLGVDWSNPDDAPLFLARGELGEIGTSDGAFTAELRGPAALLEAPVVEVTSPECRAELGDKRCRVDLALRSRVARVAAMVDTVTVDLDQAEPSGNAYGYGQLRWIGGANSGLSSAILHSAGVRLSLREPPPETMAVGDGVMLVEGCDKIFATCRDRFANGENFRGEPYLPGVDLLTRYPGA
jgi:uncharacterized phage protein (TIGR02218 family)